MMKVACTLVTVSIAERIWDALVYGSRAPWMEISVSISLIIQSHLASGKLEVSTGLLAFEGLD